MSFPHPVYEKYVLRPFFEDALTYYHEPMLAANKAHSVMLYRSGIISEENAKALLGALQDIEQIDKPSALAMYTGMMTDTGSFQFDIVTPDTFKAASELLKRGAFTPNEVSEKVYATKKVRQLKLLSMALETIRLYEAQQIAVMYVTKAMFDKTETSKEDTEGFVAYPLSLDGVKAAILFREQDGKIKRSLRSRSHIDVNKWARKLNGGGHKRAAGAWHKGPLEIAIRETIAIGKEQLK